LLVFRKLRSWKNSRVEWGYRFFPYYKREVEKIVDGLRAVALILYIIKIEVNLWKE